MELIQALDNNWIKEAKIGVFDPEPLAATHPFYSHPNIVLTCIAPVARPLDVAKCFKMNYDRFVARHPLLNTINYVSPFNSIQWNISLILFPFSSRQTIDFWFHIYLYDHTFNWRIYLFFLFANGTINRSIFHHTLSYNTNIHCDSMKL